MLAWVATARRVRACSLPADRDGTPKSHWLGKVVGQLERTRTRSPRTSARADWRRPWRSLPALRARYEAVGPVREALGRASARSRSRPGGRSRTLAGGAPLPGRGHGGGAAHLARAEPGRGRTCSPASEPRSRRAHAMDGVLPRAVLAAQDTRPRGFLREGGAAESTTYGRRRHFWLDWRHGSRPAPHRTDNRAPRPALRRGADTASSFGTFHQAHDVARRTRTPGAGRRRAAARQLRGPTCAAVGRRCNCGRRLRATAAYVDSYRAARPAVARRGGAPHALGRAGIRGAPGPDPWWAADHGPTRLERLSPAGGSADHAARSRARAAGSRCLSAP